VRPAAPLDETSAPPDPAGATTWEQLGASLRLLRAWSGFSYRDLHRGVVRLRQARGARELPVYNTVYRCLQPHRARLDADLVADIASVMLGSPSAAQCWRRACVEIAGAVRTASLPTVSVGRPVPARPFVGRADELAELYASLAAGQSNGPRVCSVVGLAGVGKTSLVRQLTPLLATRDPAPVTVWVDLGGSRDDHQPPEGAAVLTAMLAELGVPHSRIHALTPGARRAELSRRLAELHAIVVLDDAASAQQVRAVMPSGGRSTVLVTSRRTLAGLPGVSVTLSELTDADALELVRAELGADRVAAEPDAARGLIAMTGRLPIAITLLAGQVRARPDWTLTDHLGRLRARRERLRLEDTVDAALARSYEQLSDSGRRALRSVALHPGPHFDIFVANALIGADLSVARTALAELLEANLIAQRGESRFALHDLVRVFATACGQDEDSPGARQKALARELAYYRLAAARAMDHFAPEERARRPGQPACEWPTRELDGRDAATEWLAAERSNLVSTAMLADVPGGPEYVQQLSRILYRYLDSSGAYQEAELVHSRASRGPDRAAAAHALVSLGITQITTGRTVEGRDNVAHALSEFHELDDRGGAARALVTLGILSWHTGNYPDAIDHLTRSVGLMDGRDPSAEAAALGSLGIVHFLQGNYPLAIANYDRSAAVARAAGNPNMEAQALINAAQAYERCDRLDAAERCLTRGTELAESTGNLIGLADALNQRAGLQIRTGQPAQAIANCEQALATATQYAIVELEIQVLDTLGRALLAQGDGAGAVGHHERQLALSSDLGDSYNQARAHEGIARCTAHDRKPAQARAHWEQARALYSDLGHPAASEIDLLLAELPAAHEP
jgi:tetratricopeptide (TPR) repeat protein